MKRALRGRVVTMDQADTVVPDGVIYAEGGSIVAIAPFTATPPAGFEAVPVLATGGTIFPGMIELHNHLPYNVLSLGKLTKKYTNRDQWRTGAYSSEVTGPLRLLNQDPELVAALVRYVETKSVVAGVTTSQGVTLSSNAGLPKKFAGLVRNVEHTGSASLASATTHIADLAEGEADKFADKLAKAKSAVILHLAEGTDDKTHATYEHLQRANGELAVSPALAAIHAVGLHDADLVRFAAARGTIVWSPASNLFLYGATARIGKAVAAGITVSLGADWSYSGSKNLLAELKVAKATIADAGWPIASKDLVAMVTRNPARALRWPSAGHLGVGAVFDVCVVSGAAGDPYDALIAATEKDVALVMVEGRALFGLPALMNKLATSVVEDVRIDGARRVLAIQDTGMAADVAAVPLSTARARLEDAMARLPELAKDTKSLRDLEHTHVVFEDDMAAIVDARAVAPPITPKVLDPLAVADQPAYWKTFAENGNVPDGVRSRLPK